MFNITHAKYREKKVESTPVPLFRDSHFLCTLAGETPLGLHVSYLALLGTMVQPRPTAFLENHRDK